MAKALSQIEPVVKLRQKVRGELRPAFSNGRGLVALEPGVNFGPAPQWIR